MARVLGIMGVDGPQSADRAHTLRTVMEQPRPRHAPPGMRAACVWLSKYMPIAFVRRPNTGRFFSAKDYGEGVDAA